MKPAFHRLLPAAVACAAISLSGCEKTGSDANRDGVSAENAEAGFDAVHDLVIELIRRREFNAALVGIDHMEDMSDDVSEDKARQLEALRAALSAARSGPSSEPPPEPRGAPPVESPPGG